MPIYEYQCQSCGKVFEYMQRMADDPKTECEECQGELQRLISQSAFHLKGGGWYKDLYSSTKKDTKTAASESSSSSSESSPTSTDSSSKSESSTASKSESKKTASGD